MGASFCVVFEVELPHYGMLGGDNPHLLEQQPLLDELASKNGLTLLSAFESYDPADVADYIEELEGLDLPPT